LRIRAAAAAGPGHDVVALVDLAALEALFQECPDGFVVLRAEREIAAAPFGIAESFDKLMRLSGLSLATGRGDRDFFIGAEEFREVTKLLRIVPVHPVPQTLGLLGLSRRKPEDSAFAFVDEVIDAEFMDSGFGAESQLFFDFDFDPQALAVETVLVSLIMARHREESLIRILVRAAPGVMNSHRVIGSNWAVEEAPSLAARVFSSQLLKRLLLQPEPQNGMFASDKVAVGNRLKHEIRKPWVAIVSRFRKTDR